MALAQPPIAQFQQVCLRYGEAEILSGIEFTVYPGEHLAILGPNGSGKSSLVRLFSRESYPVPGPGVICRLFDKENWNIWELRSRLGIITQDLQLQAQSMAPLTTGGELVLSGYYSSLGTYDHQHYSQTQSDTAREKLEEMQAAHLWNRPLRELSTGELRRCIIARALVHNPQALLLDEPCAGLDIAARHHFLKILSTLSSHTSLILVTHHVEEIIPEIGTVCMLKAGRQYQWGSRAGLLTPEHLSSLFDMPLTIMEQAGILHAYPAE